jgi:hypothetical protein
MTTPPRILVLGFHIVWDRASAGDGGWASVYRAELEKVAPGCRVDFRSVVAGNGGVAYEAWAAAQLRGPKALGSLAACIERDYVADKGYDPAYGARPLKRVVQKNVQDPLAEALLAGRVKDGETVNVDAKAGTLTLNGIPIGLKVIEPKPTSVH